ncbi:hypothetical protein POM88_003679 [Heracleum sosnowskyi]|uniref:Uncharacterized protein n=1 Tax=Heracleum sosnowskyi TaxID=360622 RepID=A0AAD8NBW6_9APIA|nr:hypothetical protein POM88_003679 [Heracleum sosnowskyi]
MTGETNHNKKKNEKAKGWECRTWPSGFTAQEPTLEPVERGSLGLQLDVVRDDPSEAMLAELGLQLDVVRDDPSEAMLAELGLQLDVVRDDPSQAMLAELGVVEAVFFLPT